MVESVLSLNKFDPFLDFYIKKLLNDWQQIIYEMINNFEKD